MKKNYQKVLFLIVVIIAAIFTRSLYHGIFIFSTDGADSSSTSMFTLSPAPSVAVATSSQSSVLNSTDGVAANATTPYFGEASTTGSVFARAQTTQVPTFTQQASLVADLSNGVVLAARGENTRWPMASITKLMTATIVFDHLSVNTKITVTPQMLAVDPSELNIAANSAYTVNDLLHVMLMPSSNVAAEAMATYYGRAVFMAEMNQRAQAWGMTSTYFDDPSGLSSANQSSAHDLMILAQHIYQSYPQILAITRTPQTAITELNSGRQSTVKSINNFAGNANFVGGKTGYTTEAADNLLSIFNYHNHPVLIIVLGTTDRFGDTTKLLNWFTMNYQ
jgi:D-alanyl-D-alanine endopeptidase (penicillin-binding protein 7)